MMGGFFCAGPAVSYHHILFLAVLIGAVLLTHAITSTE